MVLILILEGHHGSDTLEGHHGSDTSLLQTPGP